MLMMVLMRKLTDITRWFVGLVALKRRTCVGLVLSLLLLLLVWARMSNYTEEEDQEDTNQVLTTGQPMKALSIYNWPGAKGVNVDKQWSGHKVRIFCIILTREQNWQTARVAVQQTWAQRCNRYCFFYSRRAGQPTHKDPDACPMDTEDGRVRLTFKVLEAFQYVNDHFRGKFDWILKADDDTYIIMDNLKALLSEKAPSEPYYLGYKFDHERSVPHGHNSGGAGYVLSSKAFDILMKDGQCKDKGGIEDLNIAQCLHQVMIYAQDTNDQDSQVRFHPEDPPKILAEPHHFPYFQYRKGNATMGKGHIKILSPETISFHHVSPESMYIYDFLIYDLRRRQP